MPEKPDCYFDDDCDSFFFWLILKLKAAIKDADLMQEYDDLMEKWRY